MRSAQPNASATCGWDESGCCGLWGIQYTSEPTVGNPASSHNFPKREIPLWESGCTLHAYSPTQNFRASGRNSQSGRNDQSFLNVMIWVDSMTWPVFAMAFLLSSNNFTATPGAA